MPKPSARFPNDIPAYSCSLWPPTATQKNCCTASDAFYYNNPHTNPTLWKKPSPPCSSQAPCSFSPCRPNRQKAPHSRKKNSSSPSILSRKGASASSRKKTASPSPPNCKTAASCPSKWTARMSPKRSSSATKDKYTNSWKNCRRPRPPHRHHLPRPAPVSVSSSAPTIWKNGISSSNRTGRTPPASNTTSASSQAVKPPKKWRAAWRK